MESIRAHAENESISDQSGVIARLGELPRGALVSPQALAAVFRCHQETIRRAIDSGLLPPPLPLPGGKYWTTGFILDHIENRLIAQHRDWEKEMHRIARAST